MEHAAVQLHPLKLARLERNLSQRMLADFACLGEATIKRAESGKAISLFAHRALCEYFGKTSAQLGLRHRVVACRREEVSA